MFKNKKVVVVMPAYNAERTLLQTHKEVLDQGCVDLIILVDDCSQDRTAQIASGLSNTKVLRHKNNIGYGGNQKTCYLEALKNGAEVIIMVHPDYQYTPQLIPAMASLIGNGLYHCVIGSRILGGGALTGGMPMWRYTANRFLTIFQNILVGAKLSEYHTGYRAFSKALLEQIPFESNSNDFLFDNQILMQIIWRKFTVAEITCPTKYFSEASSINFSRSVRYGFGCILESLKYRLAKFGLIRGF
jgi:glycosyltransferase involved in cell wall biosynthesis